MRRNLDEQINRMHILTYGKKVIHEASEADVALTPAKRIKKDVPNKADIIKPDIQDLYAGLNQAIKDGGLTKQSRGSFSFKKTVEAMQMSLMMLGYSLPRFGVDGLYGDETANAIAKFNSDNGLDPKYGATPEMLTQLLKKIQAKNIPNTEIAKFVDPVVMTGGYLPLNLNDKTDFQKYVAICDTFIQKYSNPLGITGSMMAYAAKNAFNKYGNYVPPELALSQMAIEGGLNGDVNSKPIRTKNPFNVGNVDSGEVVQHGNVQSGINTYYNLIARSYIGDGKKVSDLFKNFVNKTGNRYASATGYEQAIGRIASNVNKISQQYA